MAAKPKPATTAASVANGDTVPEVLTLAEAAALLRVSEDGLKGDADAGKLPGRFVAGEWRFSKTALLAWLASATGEGSTDQKRVPDQGVIKKATPNINAGFLISLGAFADDD